MTKSYCMLLLYAIMTYVKNTFYADAFLAYKIIAFSLRDSAMKNEV